MIHHILFRDLKLNSMLDSHFWRFVNNFLDQCEMLKRFHAVLVNIDMYLKITIIGKYRFDTKYCSNYFSWLHMHKLYLF